MAQFSYDDDYTPADSLELDESEFEEYFFDDDEAYSDDDFEEEDTLSDLAAIETSDTVGLYLKEMSRVPLLNQEEEVRLAIRIRDGQAAAQKLDKQPNHDRALEWQFLADDGQAAREHLIKANTRLVVSVAKKYVNRGVPFLDLIQEGNIGLMKAVSKFDHRKGFRFSTYATWWIRQTITRSIADQGRTIRVPVHMSDRIRRLYSISRTIEQDTGRKATVEELAAAMDIEITKVKMMLRVSLRPLSLEQPVGEDEDNELGNFIENDSEPSPSDSVTDGMLSAKMEELLDSLDPREAAILRLRFGFRDGRAHTLEEVGQKFGLTRERIRQIEGRALRRLRHPRRSRKIRDYLK